MIFTLCDLSIKYLSVIVRNVKRTRKVWLKQGFKDKHIIYTMWMLLRQLHDALKQDIHVYKWKIKKKVILTYISYFI